MKFRVIGASASGAAPARLSTCHSPARATAAGGALWLAQPAASSRPPRIRDRRANADMGQPPEIERPSVPHPLPPANAARRSGGVARQADGDQRGEQHEQAGHPQTGLQPPDLEHPARQQGAEQPAEGVGHVVEAHVQRHAVLLGIADDQIAVQRGVDREQRTPQFYDKYHKYIYYLYQDSLEWWGPNDGEFPDLKEITDFCVWIENEN